MVKDILLEAMSLLEGAPKERFKRLLEMLAHKTDVDTMLPIQCPDKFYYLIQENWKEIDNHSNWTETYLYDPIGEIAEEAEIITKTISVKNAAIYAQTITLPRKVNEHLPPILLDSPCGIGRKLIAAYYRFGSEALYAGIEKHIVSFRIATLNMYFHKIPSRILNDKSHLDVNKNPHDWGWAGHWLIPKLTVLQQRTTCY